MRDWLAAVHASDLGSQARHVAALLVLSIPLIGEHLPPTPAELQELSALSRASVFRGLRDLREAGFLSDGEPRLQLPAIYVQSPSETPSRARAQYEKSSTDLRSVRESLSETPTPQQRMFGAVCELFDLPTAELPPSVKRDLGRIARELAQADAEPELLQAVRAAWPRLFPGRTVPTFTRHALVRWWPELRAIVLGDARKLAEQEERWRQQHVDNGHAVMSPEEIATTFREIMKRRAAEGSSYAKQWLRRKERA